METFALDGVVEWVERWPANRRVAGSISGQDRCLICGPCPQVGVYERQPVDVSLTLMFSPPLSSSLPISLKIDK